MITNIVSLQYAANFTIISQQWQIYLGSEPMVFEVEVNFLQMYCWKKVKTSCMKYKFNNEEGIEPTIELLKISYFQCKEENNIPSGYNKVIDWHLATEHNYFIW